MKAEIVFVDTSPEVKKAMVNLSKAALRAAGKVIRKHIRDDVPKRTKNIKNHIASWVFVDKKTGQPQMQIGFYGHQRVRKRGKQPSRSSPWWIEYGTKPHEIKVLNARVMYDKSTGTYYGGSAQHPGEKATHVLRNSVYDNVDEIRAAQEEYLAELSDTIQKALGKGLDGEAEDDGDD